MYVWKRYMGSKLQKVGNKEGSFCPVCNDMMVINHLRMLDNGCHGCPNWEYFMKAYKNFIQVMVMYYECERVMKYIERFMENEDEKRMWMTRYLKVKWVNVKPIWNDRCMITNIKDMLVICLDYWTYDDAQSYRGMMAMMIGITINDYKNIVEKYWKPGAEEEKKRKIRETTFQVMRMT